MGTYEIRLLNERGESVLIYKTACLDDEHAKETVARIQTPYARYEIWYGLNLIADGARP